MGFPLSIKTGFGVHATLGTAMALVLSTPLFAQAATPPIAGEEGLNDIVVTAQKRESTAQKTAAAIAVYTSDQLKKSGVADVASLATISPSVNIGASSGASFIAIRGVASRDFTEIGDPAIAVSIDDIYIQRPTGINAGFYDLERIEVLNGPQGTLYGRNATGGAVNILTKKPSDKFEGYILGEIGNYKTINVDGAVNVPLGDTVSARASFVSRYNKGYRDNGPAGRGDDTDVQGGRLQLLFKPTDRLKILLSADQMYLGGTGAVYDGVPLTSVGGVVTTRPKTSAHAATHFDLNTVGKFDTTNTRLVGRVDYDLDVATVTSITGFMRQDLFYKWDNDGQAVVSVQPNRNFIFTRDELSKDFSQELRIASNNKSGFLWQGGVFYFREDLDLTNLFDVQPAATPINIREYHYNVITKSYAAFAQVGYDIVDALRLSAGIRYTHDSKHRSGPSFVQASPATLPVAAGGTGVRIFSVDNTKDSWSKVTWHVGADYTLSPRNLLYAKVDSGYKSGGFNNFGLGSYDPETLIAYEVGSKNRFLDNALQLNANAFLYDYKDQQISQLDGATGNTLIVNAGKAEIYGAEVEAIALATPADQVNVSVSYLHARFKDFCTARSAAGVCTSSFAGNTLIQSPTWSINAGYQHVFSVFGGDLTARVQTQYRSDQWMSFFNRATEKQKAYTRTDLSLEYSPDGAAWSIQGYVRNLENSVVLTEAAQSGLYNAIRSTYAPPRTYGARLNYKW